MKMPNSSFHHRKSIRLKEYNYSQPGNYFITVCALTREAVFGVIRDQEMIRNKNGEIVVDCWQEIPSHFPHVETDAFVVMPDHIHGIITILDSTEYIVGSRHDVRMTHDVGARHASPLPERPNRTKPGSLGAVIGSFKSAVSKRINQNLGTQGSSIWQRNYYEHIIRNDKDLNRIRLYIHNNPANWNEDFDIVSW